MALDYATQLRSDHVVAAVQAIVVNNQILYCGIEHKCVHYFLCDKTSQAAAAQVQVLQALGFLEEVAESVDRVLIYHVFRHIQVFEGLSELQCLSQSANRNGKFQSRHN